MADELLRKDQDDEYRFEIKVRDSHAMQVWQITQPVIDNGDFGYIRHTLGLLSPEMRKYIINAATLILRAAEPPDVD